MLDWMAGWIKNLLGLGAAGLFALGTYLYLQQKSLIYVSYFPEDSRTRVDRPDEHGMPNYEEIKLRTKDGLTLHAYLIKSSQEKIREITNDEEDGDKNAWTILYCHANAGNMGHRLPVVKAMVEKLNANVFIFSYRGYGLSEGSPDENGLKADAQSALDFLLQCPDLNPKRIVIYGQSIGGAVAIHLASKNSDKIHGLIVENTFLSVPKLIPHVMPIAKYFTGFCTEIWNSEQTVQTIDHKLPFLFLSSGRDELIPPKQMRQLFDLAPMKTKEFFIVPKGTHNDAVMFPEYWVKLTEFWRSRIASQAPSVHL